MGIKLESDIQELTDVKIAVDETLGHSLVVYNDDFNTFEHVTATLIKVCQHDSIQAEQCTYIIHYSGKCAVKKGDMDKLTPMRQAISEAGIKATIV